MWILQSTNITSDFVTWGRGKTFRMDQFCNVSFFLNNLKIILGANTDFELELT